MNLGRTIRMYLVDGTASGLITAEIMNWTGHAVLCPRSRLKELLAREEAQKTGVYLLYGPDPETGQETLYIGEGDDVGKRIRQHASDANKDFFERICLLTSKDHNLTKAHVRFLESRLIALVSGAGRVALKNATQPDPIRLPAADVSDMARQSLERIKASQGCFYLIQGFRYIFGDFYGQRQFQAQSHPS